MQRINVRFATKNTFRKQPSVREFGERYAGNLKKDACNALNCMFMATKNTFRFKEGAVQMKNQPRSSCFRCAVWLMKSLT